MSELGGMEVPPVVPPGLQVPSALWREVLAAYGQPNRAYHDVRHLRSVLERYAEVEREMKWQHPREVYLALLFHDAVYDVGRNDNEERSAQLARQSISRWLAQAGVDVEKVVRLVELTARHGGLSAADVSAEEALFLDCDMAVLGGAAEAYSEYEAGVAQEYSELPPEMFALGRRHFLAGLLARERIFLSEYFGARLEAAARKNIRNALEEC